MAGHREGSLKGREGTIRRLADHLAHPRRRPHGLRVAIAVAIVIISALPLERNNISAAERDVFEMFNGLPDALNVVFTPVMQLGSILAVPLLVLGVLVFLRRRRVAIDLALGGAAAWILARLIKAVVARGRPGDLLDVVVLRGDPVIGYGYVSGHAAVSAALATIAAAYLGPRGRIIVISLAATVAVARMYVGAHLPLDVAGGAALGWAVGSLVHFLLLPEILGDDATQALDP